MPSDPTWQVRAGCRPVWAVFLALAFVTVAGGAGGDDWRYWSRFGKGSWKRIRVTSETLDVGGNVIARSVTDNRITLVDRTQERITLQFTTTVNVAGKRFETPPTVVVQGPFGETDGESAKEEALPNAKVEFEGVQYDCQRRRVEIVGASTKRVVESVSNERFALAPLRRVETLLDAKNETISTTKSDIVAVNLPQQVLYETRPVTYVRTLHRNHKVAATTLSVCCADIPGQIVSASTKESDGQGRVVRRNTLELMEFQSVVDEPGGILTRAKHRREERRARR